METKFRVGQVWLSRCDAEWEIVSVNITKASYPVMARKKTSGSLATFTINGYLYADEFDSVCDLITLIKDTEETVSNLKFKIGDRVSHYISGELGTIEHVFSDGKWPYVVEWDKNSIRTVYMYQELIPCREETVSKLPPEPIPGQYYRTKNNKKMYYLGRMLDGTYLYQYCEPGECNGTFMYYSEPFHLSDKNELVDIIAPWTDPLPAAEIKRWSLICNKDYGRWKRGEFRFADNSIQEIEKVLNVYVEKEERKYWEIVELVGTLPAREQV